jgi:hypothetical protein
MKEVADLMIDLETLGQGPHAVIISIGACFFDISKGQILGTFYMATDVDGQIKDGRSVDASTIKWWMGQSGAAKKVFHEKAKPVKEVLTIFSNWVLQTATISKIKPWGNGATFDISIMEDLLKQYEVKVPWMYNGVMDLRTFKRFCAGGAQVEKLGTDHNALDDAVSQATYIIRHVHRVQPSELTPAEIESVKELEAEKE